MHPGWSKFETCAYNTTKATSLNELCGYCVLILALRTAGRAGFFY